MTLSSSKELQGGTFEGEYNSCLNSPLWSGSASIFVTFEAGAEVAARFPGEIIIIEGEVKGETGITEKITVKTPNLIVAGNWDGLTVKGAIKLKTYGGFNAGGEAKETILDPKVMPVLTFALPSLLQ